jgi:subtilisin-like proprotein convertase family protein
MVGLLLLVLAPAACGDSSGDGDNGDDAGAGGSSGEAGSDTGGSSTGGSSTGGRGGTSTGGRGGTSAGEGGDAGDGVTGGSGGEGGEEMGGAGAGGEPTGGAGTGGMAGGGAGGAGAGGMAGGGAGAGGMAGGGTGGSAGSAPCTESPLRCALGTCPAGTSAAFYTASGVPVVIPDNNLTNPALATIAITTPGLVSRIVVQTSITHTFDADLEIGLVTPYATRDLSSDNGMGGDNYTNTVFADSGMLAITAGVAPFSDVYRPEQDLASLSGVPLAGNYRLRVADDLANDTGQITNFQLGVCQCLASSGQCEFGLACQNGIDDDSDGLIDCQEPNCASSPSCPKPESACGDGIDNDADTMVDCADPSCAWACEALNTSCTGANRIFAYAAGNLPQPIPPTGTSRIGAPIFASAGGSIVTAAVRFSATHTFTGDLSLLMSSPGSIILDLTSSNGGTGEHYLNTVFIDSAANPITGGTAPFTGPFRPEQALSGWTGQPALGLWQGDLSDSANGDGGSFDALSLAVCVTP